jgi:hypothetical protein
MIIKRFLCYGEMVSKQIITALTFDYLTCVCPDWNLWCGLYGYLFLFLSDYINFLFLLMEFYQKDNTC